MNDSWNSKVGFIVSAIGSAVGLGNLWRFPYVAATHGGGAFLLPYFIAIITAGIPILIMEYTIGKTYRGGAPAAFARLNQKFEWLGWAQVMISFMIFIYYLAIVVWTLSYVGFSFTQAWGKDPTSFFSKTFLGVTANAHTLGGVQTNLILPFIVVWILAAVIMYRGISRGVEKVCKIGLPVLLVLTCILVIRGITLPHSADGLQYMFKPDWSSLGKSDVWVAAYGQIFYSLSIAFGIMISYSSYLPMKTDVVNSAFITATANHGFELFAGIGVFSIIGYMANVQGVPVEKVAGSGVGLAFMTFPTAISSLPTMQALVGVCFFGALFVAGITSLVSISQVIVTALEGKFDLSHNKAVTITLVPAFFLSVFFITGAGLSILDILDAFVNNVGLAVSGFLELLLVGWFFKLDKIRLMANRYSNFPASKVWFVGCLKFVTVIMLGIMTFLNTRGYVLNGYGGYAQIDINIFGWGSLVIVLIGTVILTAMKGDEGYTRLDPETAEEVALYE